MQKVSTVIPVRNEEGNIIKLSQKIFNSLKKYNNELIFIDDGSNDSTKKKIIEKKSRVFFLIKITVIKQLY